MTCLHSAPSAISRIYTEEEIALLDKNCIPSHVAIIPDGNRRWAKNKRFSTESGHREGGDTILEIVKAGKELGVKAITFYLFSTENWHRPQEEIAALMWLLQSYLIDQKQAMINHEIRLHTIGDLTRMPLQVVKTIEETKSATQHCQKIDMILALNYGGRDDLRRAMQKLIKDVDKGIISEEITEDLISSYLDTSHWKDPDLLIRTSGELRLSNFLLWQISYTEIFVSKVLWPDFTPQHFFEALLCFQKRHRRHGGT